MDYWDSLGFYGFSVTEWSRGSSVVVDVSLKDSAVHKADGGEGKCSREVYI